MGGARQIAAEELKQHRTPGDLWVALKGDVYDVTQFAAEHPGGDVLINGVGGRDGTADFLGMHPASYLGEYLGAPIGKLVEAEAEPVPAAQPAATTSNPPLPEAGAEGGQGKAAPTPAPQAPAAAPAAEAVPPALKVSSPPSPSRSQAGSPSLGSRRADNQGWFKVPRFAPQPPGPPPAGFAFRLTLQRRKQISENTVNLHFKADCAVTLTPGQHIYLMKDGVTRPYTPISLVADRNGGSDIVFVIKFYPDGAMSRALDAVQKGDIIAGEVRPFTKFRYLDCGWYVVGADQSAVPRHARCIGMVAGGTGITPMFSVLKAILGNPYDTTVIYLLFANQTPDDVLMRGGLETLQRDFPDRFHIWFTVDRCAQKDIPSWQYSLGYITPRMLRFLPRGPEDLCLLCGPPPMTGAVEKSLNADPAFAAPIVKF